MKAVEPELVLNVYKEISWTSHDAVGRVRRILGVRQVGHGGSLDPLAAGVLVVCVGRATKIMQYLTDLPKTYRGTMILGRKTRTGDSDGETVIVAPVPALGLIELGAAAISFTGRIQQTPPMVSAVKVQGRRLYDLARKGVEIERKPRTVEVHRFQITAVALPRVDFVVECGKGTYVRTLVEDFAERLGTVGSLECLVRTRVGPFHVDDACRLISLPCSEPGGLHARGLSVARALDYLPAARTDATWIRKLRQGVVPPIRAMDFADPPTQDQRVRIVGRDGDLAAIGRLEFLPGPADRPPLESLAIRLERVF